MKCSNLVKGFEVVAYVLQHQVKLAESLMGRDNKTMQKYSISFWAENFQ